MKKSIFAGILLLTVLLASIWNIRHMDRFSGSLMSGLDSAEMLWNEGRFDEAVELVEKLIGEWRAGDGYTHIFVRHSEVDSTSDCFFELLSALKMKEAGAADAAAELLRYHLTSIREMEHITLRSVF